MTQHHPSVAIVGAGPAGLTAANILHRHGWSITVFESDTAPDSRDQGGTLDLHPDGGQAALEKAGLLDAFLAEARHEDQEMRVRDHATGAPLHEFVHATGTGDRPEIDRSALRDLLLRPLGMETVRWGQRIEDIVAGTAGRHFLRTSDGDAGPFDLIIGADGAWSRVRRALSKVQPIYTGVTFVELWLSDIDTRHPALAKLVGHGTLFALHDAHGLFAQRNGGGTVRVYAAFHNPADDGERADQTLTGITKAALLERFAAWSPELKALIAEADRIAAERPIFALPVDFRWEHRPGITLVGDAAHVMPPMGEGVNLAMRDAAELAEALVANANWRQAVESSEVVMKERSGEIARECHEGFAEWFSVAGTAAVLARFDARQDGRLD